MKLTDEIQEALKEYRRLHQRYKVANGEGLAHAWYAKRELHAEKILIPLLLNPKSKDAFMQLKLSGRLEHPVDIIWSQWEDE